MSFPLALSAPASPSSDYIGAPTASLSFPDLADVETGGLEAEPAARVSALGAAVQALSTHDAAAVLEALADQATALSLVLAADTAGAITLPESLRAIVRAAAVLPPFLSGAN